MNILNPPCCDFDEPNCIHKKKGKCYNTCTEKVEIREIKNKKGNYNVYVKKCAGTPFVRQISKMRDLLLNSLEEIKKNFEDNSKKTWAFFRFESKIVFVKNQTIGNLPLYELLMGIFYTIKNIEPENLTLDQIEYLEKVIRRIKKKLTEDAVDEIYEELFFIGMKPVVEFRGLAEIYKKQGLI